MQNRLFRRGKDTRRAAAVVELAICLPVIVLLVFASLEGANMLFLRQAVVQSAYEAAKASAKSRGSEARGRTLAQQILTARNVPADQINIGFNPANVDTLAPGTQFTVTITVPGAVRSITGVGPFGGRNVTASATMSKE